MRLGIGTVQFGLDYGVTNTRGRVAPEVVDAVLDRAGTAGVSVVDTSTLYGESEATLGAALAPGHRFNIVTKTPQFRAAIVTATEVDALLATLRQSLVRLRQPNVYGLLLHRVADAFSPGGERLIHALQQAKAEGLVSKIGASVYTADEIDRLLAMGGIDLIQLPLNWLDQRLARSGHLEKLHAAGIEIHARSAFLQGVLLHPPQQLPAYFAPLREHLASCRARFESWGLSPVAAALAYPLSRKEVSTVVCGVTSLDELVQLIDAYTDTPPVLDWNACPVAETAWLDPSKWPSTARAQVPA